ncbi:MAG: beta-lactamase family protein [Gemmatimonadetes bacterium]|nr:beta-lactamase family protein [Gemmatimonadota bacterium]
MRGALLTAVLLGAASACVAQDTPSADTDRALEIAREVHERLENVGYQLHVSNRGQTVLDAQLGFARLEDSVPVAADTRFLIMSVTKPFTGAALVKAVTAGLLDPDDPISEHVRDYPPGRDPNMTLRSLAAHTAGAPHFGHPARKALYVQHFSTATEAIAAIRDSALTHDPGTAYEYSSSNYNLIAAALERVSGQPFAVFLDSAVLAPLGLGDTELLNVQRPTPRLARNYTLFDLWTYADLDELQIVPTWDYSFNPAGGGMISTASDLARFGEAFLEPGFFSEEELELFYTLISADPGSPWSYGWFVGETDRGTRQLRISGATQGVMASLYVWPAEGLVGAAIVNSWTREARDGELVFAGLERIMSAYLAAGAID